MLIFEALSVDCADFEALTVDFAIIYERIGSNSTPSLIYRLTVHVSVVHKLLV